MICEDQILRKQFREQLFKELERYPVVWRTVLKEVLLFNDLQIASWVDANRENLLTDPSYTLHEEPWYWVCTTVVDALRHGEPTDWRKSEIQVFFILAAVFQKDKKMLPDWLAVRLQCIDAAK